MYEKCTANMKYEFVDMRFEGLLDDLDDKLKQLKSPAADCDHLNLFLEVCRGIRAAKLEFPKVLRRYGMSYEKAAMRFVDVAYAAADLAANNSRCTPELRTSLDRHAREAEQERSRVFSNTTRYS